LQLLQSLTVRLLLARGLEDQPEVGPQTPLDGIVQAERQYVAGGLAGYQAALEA
jgi:hypothetical protein